MRLLVLGGTAFLSHAVAAEAVRRGHEVTCAARGVSGSPPEAATLVRVDRADQDGLRPLAGRKFDAVVDVELQSPTRVRRALDALAGSVGHWTFVSTASVYADNAVVGQRCGTAALLKPAPDGADETDRELYGPLKVSCEQAVQEVVGGRAFVCRPGLIVGPGDRSDRFGYWPGRLHRGGRVLVPGDPTDPVQYVDVRDLARWIVYAAEQRLVATLDAICPPLTWGELVTEIRDAVGGNPELVWVPSSHLAAWNVPPWAGPESLPMWLPPGHDGFMARDVSESLAAGLRIRPVADTARASLAWETELGSGRERGAGLSAEREAELVAAYLNGAQHPNPG